jgi:hypothetical protein
MHDIPLYNTDQDPTAITNAPPPTIPYIVCNIVIMSSGKQASAILTRAARNYTELEESVVELAVKQMLVHGFTKFDEYLSAAKPETVINGNRQYDQLEIIYYEPENGIWRPFLFYDNIVQRIDAEVQYEIQNT